MYFYLFDKTIEKENMLLKLSNTFMSRLSENPFSIVAQSIYKL